MKLKNRVALVTGAASGMGKLEAIALANEGAKIIAADIKEKELQETVEIIKQNGGEAIGIKTDIGNIADIENLVAEGVKQFGTIDILLNTAGIMDDFRTGLESTDEQWTTVLNINLNGIFRLTKLVLPYMIEKGKGSIINTASIAGLVSGAGGIAYTTSKHAVIGYTKQLSYEFAPQGIKVNAICPGPILTEMTRINLDKEFLVEAKNSLPSRRFGEPEEVIPLILFLASDDSDYIHGAAIPIDGGWTIK